MPNFVNHANLNKNELRNAVVHPLASAPSSPIVGQEYYSTVDFIHYVWNGSAWVNKATDSLLLGGQSSAYHLSRANHTGTQLAATVSDFDTQVRTSRLDQLSAPTAAVGLNSQKITALADPTNPQDAATKNYTDNAVSSAAAGIDSKPSVRVVATGNITLSGLQTIDGVTVSAADRVLLTAQTTGSQNGVYAASSGAWTRVADADQTGEITPGAFWFVEEGTTYNKSQWRCNNSGTITLGTTSITIVQFGAAAGYTASLGVQLVGSDIRAQVVASGGVSAVAGGLQIDTAVVPLKYSVSIGDGSATSYVVTHNLGTRDLIVRVREVASPYNYVESDYQATSTTTVTVLFAAPPSSNQYRVVVMG